MNGNMQSHDANRLDPVEKTTPGTLAYVVEKVQEKNENQDYSRGKSLGEKVRKEVRDRLGEVGDEIFDEDDSAEVPILEEEDIIRGTRGVGALWKLSLCATISFATYILFSSPHFEPNWIPNISERDPIPKICRPRSRKK